MPISAMGTCGNHSGTISRLNPLALAKFAIGSKLAFPGYFKLILQLNQQARGVAEVSVYISKENLGEGIGTSILKRLITESESRGIWTLQAGIFPENVASLKLHKRLGFREVGYREKIGKMGDRWRNTILLERRCKNIQ